MRKPVAVPAREATAEETTRRRPEVVAVVRRTPWKKSGLGRWGRALEGGGEGGEGGLHVEEHRGGDEGGDVVREDEIHVRGFEHQVERHDGLRGAGLDVEEEGEEKSKYGEGGDDEGMRPGQDVSTEVLAGQ
jgi:hypothetical protein